MTAADRANGNGERKEEEETEAEEALRKRQTIVHGVWNRCQKVI